MTQDQQFYKMEDPQCQRMLDKFLSKKAAPKVEVSYFAQLEYKTPGSAQSNKCSFRETRLAKHDSDFNHALCHSIAFHYRDNGSMLELAANNAGGRDKVMCCNCGNQPGVEVAQVPTESWHVQPIVITETAGYVLCGSQVCETQIRQRIFQNIQGFKRMYEEIKQQESFKQCMSCKKIDENLKRCSRCKNAYFCDATCLKRAWAEHKKDCVMAG